MGTWWSSLTPCLSQHATPSTFLATVVLRHVVKGLEGDALSELHGLRLVPLLSGGWGRLSAQGEGGPLLLCPASERPLLAPHAHLVVDVDADSPGGASGTDCCCCFCCCFFLLLFSLLQYT